MNISLTGNSFDLWVTLTSLGRGLKLTLPAHKYRHFNSFLETGWKLKSGGRLRKHGNQIVLDAYFEKDMPEPKEEGKTIGIDIGYKKLIATSEGQLIGKEFSTIASKIARKKQDSKAFKKALLERDEFINRTVKQLPWTEVKTFVVEDLKGLKQGRRFTKKFQAKFQRWTYPQLIKRLELQGEISGVHVCRVNPAYTSQTCSRCGEQDKRSRNGEVFVCTACGWEGDADLNASVNILKKFRLPEDMDPAQKSVLM